MTIAQQIAREIGVKTAQVNATIELLDQGDSVAFIARYRKEVTAGLDDIQLRALEERVAYLRQLNKRREAIIHSIEQQQQMTAPLLQRLQNCSNKTELEDLYLPFKPKRTSKASIAREAGLQPLADLILGKNSVNPQYVCRDFINPEKGIADADSALSGAEHIIIEKLSENADLLKQLRFWMQKNAVLNVSVKRGKKDPQSKFRDFFEFSQAYRQVPPHRALAIFRGIKEGILKLQIEAPEHSAQAPLKNITATLRIDHNRRSQDYWLQQVAEHAWSLKIQPQLESDLSKALKEEAEQSSIDVFATNLSDLLMAAPAGQKVTMGLDPGLRNGVKLAVIAATGELVNSAVIYPHAPQRKWQESIDKLRALVDRHNVELIAIGNGTASRETEQLVKALAEQSSAEFTSLIVSEAGASVYSASEIASAEFPDVVVSIRGAISIARRLQDPLSELVKIDPKAIGVGQYQHDVNQKALTEKLANVVEDCVNKVGVNLNNASVQLLTQVAGINSKIAQNIVAMREQKGAFKDRKTLLKVPGLGAKSYQQCAGFLRLINPNQPLDNSAVHPESYPLVAKMAVSLQLKPAALVGNIDNVERLDANQFCDEQYGHYTVSDTLAELAKPGRDPRPEFKTSKFDDSVNEIEDLTTGMQLEGVVSNVTHFGAFVDIGVHQDGLVHISQLADQFVKDPHQIVKAGQIVQVRVTEVDIERRRIALSMKSKS